MSVCHIWLGVDLSNRRGGASRFLRRLLVGVANPVSFKCRRTLEGLALKKNIRRRIWEILRTPEPGAACLRSVIFFCTTTGSLFPPAPAGLRRSSPSSPPSRYRRIQTPTALQETPSSRATTPTGIPSSRCNCTARRLNSRVFSLLPHAAPWRFPVTLFAFATPLDPRARPPGGAFSSSLPFSPSFFLIGNSPSPVSRSGVLPSFSKSLLPLSGR